MREVLVEVGAMRLLQSGAEAEVAQLYVSLERNESTRCVSLRVCRAEASQPQPLYFASPRLASHSHHASTLGAQRRVRGERERERETESQQSGVSERKSPTRTHKKKSKKKKQERAYVRVKQ